MCITVCVCVCDIHFKLLKLRRIKPCVYSTQRFFFFYPFIQRSWSYPITRSLFWGVYLPGVGLSDITESCVGAAGFPRSALDVFVSSIIPANVASVVYEVCLPDILYLVSRSVFVCCIHGQLGHQQSQGLPIVQRGYAECLAVYRFKIQSMRVRKQMGERMRPWRTPDCTGNDSKVGLLSMTVHLWSFPMFLMRGSILHVRSSTVVSRSGLWNAVLKSMNNCQTRQHPTLWMLLRVDICSVHPQNPAWCLAEFVDNGRY